MFQGDLTYLVCGDLREEPRAVPRTGHSSSHGRLLKPGLLQKILCSIVILMLVFSTQLDELKTEVTGALGRLGRVDEDNKTLLEKINNLGGRLAALDSKDGEAKDCESPCCKC